MNVIILLVGLATFFSTLLGGLFAIRFRDRLHLILGFSAGAVIGVALFDLIPESINLGTKLYSTFLLTGLIAAGFVLYMTLDRLFSLHLHCKEDCEKIYHQGYLAAGSLIAHSFLDGFGIGLAFKVSSSLGWVVAGAVLVHDFSDGINTVNMILKNEGKSKSAFRWLVSDALAPLFGIAVASFFNISESILGLILAVFAGFFLYLGASDLVPESHHRHPSLWTTLMTILGISTLYVVVYLVP